MSLCKTIPHHPDPQEGCANEIVVSFAELFVDLKIYQNKMMKAMMQYYQKIVGQMFDRPPYDCSGPESK